MEEVAVVKKRGRPAKSGGAAAVNASAVGSIPIIPKKRGRPPKSAKGRGRPPKVETAGSDNDDLDEDELGEANGELPTSQPVNTKGRGRPRKAPVQLLENSGSEDNDSSAEEKPAVKQQKPSPAKRRKLGRPRKHQPSDEDEDDDDEEEERRPLGRPDTGAVKLNIVRSGRGQGRPKKKKNQLVGNRPVDDDAAESNGDNPPKKLGRPVTTGNRYVPTGRPRGRPKLNLSPKKAANVNEDDDDDNDNGDDIPKLIDESDENEGSADAEAELLTATTTPKKRGRPSMGNKSAARTKVHKPTADNDDDADDSAAGEDLVKKRGRPSTGKSGAKSSKTTDANGGGGDSISDADEDSIVYGGDDSDGPLPGKPKTINASKSDRKEQKSPQNGDGDAAFETSESVECVSDEHNWPDA